MGRTSPAHTDSVPWTAALPQPGTPPTPGYLAGPGEGLGHLAVPAPVAGGDEIGHAAALQECGRGHLAFAEDPGEGNHLHEPQADDGGFRVVATEKAVTEPGAYGHDVLGKRQEVGRCRHSHTHCGRECRGDRDDQRQGCWPASLGPTGPRVPLLYSERRKEGAAPIHGANSPAHSGTWTQREASAREREWRRGISS